MKCIYCQGAMARKSAPYHVDRKGYHLVLDTIPAWVCKQCGEVYFEETEVQQIQKLIRSLDSNTTDLPKSA